MIKLSVEDEEKLITILEQMKEVLSNSGDPESGHSMADQLLCDALTILGQHELVSDFDEVEKWYA